MILVAPFPKNHASLAENSRMVHLPQQNLLPACAAMRGPDAFKAARPAASDEPCVRTWARPEPCQN
jgi:hypothetical protein